MKLFIFPSVVAAAVGFVALIAGGWYVFTIVALLAVLETSLSFDNAVVNASVLRRMDAIWQRRFLVWGIPVAVFGVRFVLPLLIVSVAIGISPVIVAKLALFDPVRYGMYIEKTHTAIAAFGSAFLFLVSLKYFFDDRKTVHWITIVERHLARWGGIAAIEVALTIAIMLLAAAAVEFGALTVLAGGAVGIVSFIAVESVAQTFKVEAEAGLRHAKAGFGHARAGLPVALFVYLNVLDSAFSLDEVVAAFAITSDLLVIVAGLSIGALFVRAFTVSLVRARTLETLRYLEHGAHWAIFALALLMLMSIFVHVPEVVSGLMGVFFVGLAYLSSRRELRA